MSKSFGYNNMARRSTISRQTKLNVVSKRDQQEDYFLDTIRAKGFLKVSQTRIYYLCIDFLTF